MREVDRTSVTRRVGTTQAVNKAHLTQAAEAMRSPAQRQVIQPEMSMRMAAKTPQRPKRGAEECREAQRAEHEDLGRALQSSPGQSRGLQANKMYLQRWTQAAGESRPLSLTQTCMQHACPHVWDTQKCAVMGCRLRIRKGAA